MYVQLGVFLILPKLFHLLLQVVDYPYVSAEEPLWFASSSFRYSSATLNMRRIALLKALIDIDHQAEARIHIGQSRRTIMNCDFVVRVS